MSINASRRGSRNSFELSPNCASAPADTSEARGTAATLAGGIMHIIRICVPLGMQMPAACARDRCHGR